MWSDPELPSEGGCRIRARVGSLGSVGTDFFTGFPYIIFEKNL